MYYLFFDYYESIKICSFLLQFEKIYVYKKVECRKVQKGGKFVKRYGFIDIFVRYDRLWYCGFVFLRYNKVND